MEQTIGKIDDWKRFSNFHKLVRITTYILMAARYFKAKGVSEPKKLSKVEQCWIKDYQKMLC